VHPRRRVHPRPHQFHQSCVEVDRHDIQAEQIRKGKRIADHRRKALCFGPVWSLLHIEYWFPAYRYRRYSAQMKYFERLTARESQCLELLSAPMRPKEIALHLSLSVKTVEAHLASAKAKLSANSTLHASRLYREYLEYQPRKMSLRTLSALNLIRRSSQIKSVLEVRNRSKSGERSISDGNCERRS